MRKVALLGKRKIAYTVRRSVRARRTGITVYPDGSIVLTVPHSGTVRGAEAFLRSKSEWVLKRIRECKTRPARRLPPPSRRYYFLYREHARRRILARLSYYNEHYGFAHGDVRVKNLVSQWGSCSEKKNLNFNYRVVFLPSRLCNYVIVHELCHAAELNHSSRFWRLVSEAFPDYERLERELSRYTLVRF